MILNILDNNNNKTDETYNEKMFRKCGYTLNYSYIDMNEIVKCNNWKIIMNYTINFKSSNCEAEKDY